MSIYRYFNYSESSSLRIIKRDKNNNIIEQIPISYDSMIKKYDYDEPFMLYSIREFITNEEKFLPDFVLIFNHTKKAINKIPVYREVIREPLNMLFNEIPDSTQPVRIKCRTYKLDVVAYAYSFEVEKDMTLLDIKEKLLKGASQVYSMLNGHIKNIPFTIEDY